MIGSLLIFNIKILQKMFLFCSKVAKKRRSALLFGKIEHIFAKFESSKKNIILLMFVVVMMYLSDFTTFYIRIKSTF